jgi:carboxymethylenebutenolidase
MCDQDDFKEMLDAAQRPEAFSRRRFGAWSLGAGLASLGASLPGMAATEVRQADVNIKTPSGTADCFFVHPAIGTHPGILMWPDIMGLRPAFKLMARRLAEAGYSVLVPNPFYRQTKAPVMGPGESFANDETRKKLMGLMGSLTPDVQVADAKAFVRFLDTQPSVAKKIKMGTMGYCMGGPFTFRTAATFPDRIGAAASFHGAGLATDKPDSPHLLVPKIKAQYLIAIAANDDEREPKAKDMLREAFDKAHVPAEIEVYSGTMHGWCPPDSAVYNEGKAEQAWGRAEALFKKALV